jgi:hypothetical protein
MFHCSFKRVQICALPAQSNTERSRCRCVLRIAAQAKTGEAFDVENLVRCTSSGDLEDDMMQSRPKQGADMDALDNALRCIRLLLKFGAQVNEPLMTSDCDDLPRLPIDIALETGQVHKAVRKTREFPHASRLHTDPNQVRMSVIPEIVKPPSDPPPHCSCARWQSQTANLLLSAGAGSEGDRSQKERWMSLSAALRDEENACECLFYLFKGHLQDSNVNKSKLSSQHHEQDCCPSTSSAPLDKSVTSRFKTLDPKL